VNRLALGTVQFGLSYGIANQTGQVSLKEATKMLQQALVNGISTLDTAVAYGESETCLGEVGIDKFKIVTKLPAMPNGCSDVASWVKQQVTMSLSRMRVNKVYGLLLHRPEQLLGSNGLELYEALQTLKESGQVQKIGISIYSPAELDELIPRYGFELVQAPFNLVDQRLYSSGWLSGLKEFNVEIHTRSSFLQGLLLMNKVNIPLKFSPWDGLWNKWHKWLLENDISALHACLAFPLSFPEIERVVVGADSATQLAQILSAANKLLQANLPDIQCDDDNLINPANWNRL
jgi:aryl-alcohol dehydrogenase-like predicted oxidoreductase